ncbi:MAG: hypothetical protein WCY93_08980 [Anaerolineaceae bacterium]
MKTEREHLIKDPRSGALLNTDLANLVSFKAQKKHSAELNKLRYKIEELEEKVKFLLSVVKDQNKD